MVIVDFEGKVVEGALNPSSDTPTHRCLFLAFSEIRSVVHTHSRKAVAFAQAAFEIPLLGTTHADYFRGPIPLTRALTPEEIASAYEWETGNVIVESFANSNPNDIPAVLVRNHGPFTWGPTAAKAVENALALEIVADMAYHALTLVPNAVSPALALSEKHFFRKHGATATYGQKQS
jgi:L-ribulose-5-phosphate 4-epimerase